jgi:hypothetical protein
VRSVSSRSASASPIGHQRDRADDDQPEQARGPIRYRWNRSRQRHRHGDEVAPEIDEDGGQRADVAGHVEGTAELLGVPAEEGSRENQVG